MTGEGEERGGDGGEGRRWKKKTIRDYMTGRRERSKIPRKREGGGGGGEQEGGLERGKEEGGF